MPPTARKTDTEGANAVPDAGDHDRVAMLSLNPDGSPAQHNPEFIGDREAALAATREQFRTQAVSAADTIVRGTAPGTGDAEEAPQDPTVTEVQEAHDAAVKAADKAADAAVKALG